MIMYRYALDENDKRVFIGNITSREAGRAYTCPECKGTLYPRGLKENSKVESHFYHHAKEGVGSSGQCNGESYIHWISKELLAEGLQECKPFILKYQTEQKCLNAASYSKCVKKTTEEIDISKEYVEVFVEKRDGEFIPDIMLKNANGEKIYIEIYQSSAISQKKIDSGQKIIQIKIRNHHDVENILKERTLRENAKTGVEYFNFKAKNFDCEGSCYNPLPVPSPRPKFIVSKRPPVVVKPTSKKLNYAYSFTEIHKQRMVGFWSSMKLKYGYSDKLSRDLSIVYKGRDLWFVSCCNEFFFVSHFEMYHIVYEIEDGKIVQLVKSLTFGDLDYKIKQYVVERDGML